MCIEIEIMAYIYIYIHAYSHIGMLRIHVFYYVFLPALLPSANQLSRQSDVAASAALTFQAAAQAARAAPLSGSCGCMCDRK